MWLGRVSNPGPLTYESGGLTTAPRGPAALFVCSPAFRGPQNDCLAKTFQQVTRSFTVKFTGFF